MPFIQVFDDKKECWVLKKVKEVPKVEVAEGDRDNFFVTNLNYTFDAEVMRRLQNMQPPRLRPVQAQMYVQYNDAHYVEAAQRWYGGRTATRADTAREVTHADHPVGVVAQPATYFPGSGEPPDRDTPRENQHERRVREYKAAMRRKNP